MKKYVFMFVAAVLAGTFIWSCSQDGMEDRTIYRYNAEQLAEIRALAEMYGVSDVQYPTESETGLPTIEELEKGFQIVSAIRASLNHPLEVIESDENGIVLRTRRSLAKRTVLGDEQYDPNKDPYEYRTGFIDLSGFQTIEDDGETYECWLTCKISWNNVNAGNADDSHIQFDINVSLPSELLTTAQISTENKKWKWVGAWGIEFWYTCDIIIHRGSTSYILEDAIDIHDHITVSNNP